MASPIIHPTADVSPQARIGEGTRIWNNVQVREGVSIGSDCIVGKDVYIDKDVVVGSRVKVQNSALLYRPLSIEDGVFVGPQALFANDRVPRSVTPEGDLKAESDWSQVRTTVRRGASVGAAAIILPGVEIGAWAMIGAGSLVTGDVPAHGLVTGSPGRRTGWVCRCGQKLPGEGDVTCAGCARRYRVGQVDCTEA